MNIFENIQEILCSGGIENSFNFLFYLSGFTILAIWLLDTSFGKKSLDKTRHRRNSMPSVLPLVIFFAVFFAIYLVSISATLLADGLQDSQKILIDKIVNIIARLVSIGIIIYIVKTYFARGVKGFGLNIKTIPRDFAFAFVYLIAIIPLMNLILAAIVFFNELMVAPNYHIPTHEELKTLTDNSNITIRLAISVGTVIVVPFFEEMLFRGLFQTMIRSSLYFYKQSAWIAILLTSVFFAITHANPSHWPVLFVLSLAIGYSYEKSGSLFRPVFMHMIFNGSAIFFTWIQ